MIPPMLFTGFFAVLRCRQVHLTAKRMLHAALRAKQTHLNAGFASLTLIGFIAMAGAAHMRVAHAEGLSVKSASSPATSRPPPSKANPSETGPSEADQSDPSAHEFKFSVAVEGRKLPDDIKAQIEGTIEIGKGNEATQPKSLGQLRRRATEEAQHLKKVLRSQAYFNGRIVPVIEEAQGGRFDLIYRVTLGPRTMIRSFKINYPDHPADMAALPSDATPLGLKPNRAARAQRIIDLTADALTWLKNHGHPAPELEKRDVVVDLAENLADITLTIKAGPPKHFGPLRISNHSADDTPGRTDTAYIRELATFNSGDLYDKRQADATIAALRGSNLFDQVSIDIVDAEGGTVTPDVTLVERPRRSIGVGTSWSSDEGAGVSGFWEHRNLFGRAEKLRLELSIAQTKQSAKADFSKPRFLRPDQTFLASYEFANEDTDAYNEVSTKLGTGLMRQLTPTLQGSAGVSLEIYRTEENSGNHSYRLFGLPLTLRYDGSDNLLDPTEGARLSGALTPYVGQANGSPAAITKFEGAGSTYFSFGKRPDLTLAFRGRYGLMLAEDTLDVPGSLRFYAGGGGSIRGYAYQLVGPLDAANDPVGGRSVVEASSEVRYRITDTIGLVAFLDGGNAYTTSIPKLNQALLWGAGLGVRYYTPIGPVRADIGVPLNRRSGIDDAFQVYFSLGQAF
jgi:translocation and assembly module TamA